jgi:hypothetical protein
MMSVFPMYLTTLEPTLLNLLNLNRFPSDLPAAYGLNILTQRLFSWFMTLCWFLFPIRDFLFMSSRDARSRTEPTDSLAMSDNGS